MERHPLDPASLVFGLLFILVAAALLLFDLSNVRVADLRWLGPVAALGVGAWLVLSAGLSRRSTPPRDGDDPEGAEDPDPVSDASS